MRTTKKEPSALHAEGSRIAVRLSRERYKYNTGGVLVSRVPFVILSEAKNPVRFAQGLGDPSLALRMTVKEERIATPVCALARNDRLRRVGGEGCG